MYIALRGAWSASGRKQDLTRRSTGKTGEQALNSQATTGTNASTKAGYICIRQLPSRRKFSEGLRGQSMKLSLCVFGTALTLPVGHFAFLLRDKPPTTLRSSQCTVFES